MWGWPCCYYLGISWAQGVDRDIEKDSREAMHCEVVVSTFVLTKKTKANQCSVCSQNPAAQRHSRFFFWQRFEARVYITITISRQ